MPSLTTVQKRSILFLDHAPAIGGAERSLLLLLRNLDRNQWFPHLAGEEGPFLESATAFNTVAHPLSMPNLRRSLRFLPDWFMGALTIYQLAQLVDAALIYANTVRAAFYAGLAAFLARRPFVWHMHDFWLTETRPHRMFSDTLGKKILCRAASLVIANSTATASYLPCTDKVHIVHNGIDIAHFTIPTDTIFFRQQHHIPPEALLVGMAGRMRPWKGQERFLHMARQVLRSLPGTHFLLVGGDPFQVDASYEKDLRGLTEGLGISDSVTFTGHLEEIRPALASMDVFVHPGDPEPFGLVNIEAMASGKPVVAFGHGALPEIVIHGETGILVTPGDHTELAQAVIHLLHDPKLRSEMGQSSRQRVWSHFTIQETAAKISQHIQQLVR